MSSFTFKSDFFPHVNCEELAQFAVECALTYEHGRGLENGPPVLSSAVNSMEDVIWGGEKMIEITLDPALVAPGPTSLMAHFPVGHPELTTEAYMGMVHEALSAKVKTAQPASAIYSSTDSVGAEIILLVKVPGQSLDSLWPTLSNKQRKAACRELSNEMLKLFNHRGTKICTVLRHVNCDDGSVTHDDSLLLTRAFDIGHLHLLHPQPSFNRTLDYLMQLILRVYNAINSTGEDLEERAKYWGWPGKSTLSWTERAAITETYGRLAKLVPYHTGGWYVSRGLGDAAFSRAWEILAEQKTAIYHSDLQMSRIIVQLGDKKDDISLTIATGWEHAYFAPLWSCARMPSWLQVDLPQAQPFSISQGDQRRMSRVIYEHLRPKAPGDDSPQHSLEWIVAYTHGQQERFFEECLNAHWMCRDAFEMGIVQLKRVWEYYRPDVAFPITAGYDSLLTPHPIFNGSAVKPSKQVPTIAATSTSANQDSSHWTTMPVPPRVPSSPLPCSSSTNLNKPVGSTSPAVQSPQSPSAVNGPCSSSIPYRITPTDITPKIRFSPVLSQSGLKESTVTVPATSAPTQSLVSDSDSDTGTELTKNISDSDDEAPNRTHSVPEVQQSGMKMSFMSKGLSNTLKTVRGVLRFGGRF